jgi:integrase
MAKSPTKPFPNPLAIKKHILRTTHYLAKANNQPGYLDIHAHIFRHFRACRLYWETKDILYVKEFLGHRSISSTMKYLQLTELGGDETFTVKAVTKAEEAIPLLEKGFLFSNMIGDIALYKKRK